MLVTMPFVLLLLDYWPLNRLTSFTPRVVLRLVTEKIPLFVLTVGSCVATALVPEKVAAGDKLSFALRMENAVVSYVTYLWQMMHPARLACCYPNPADYLPLWQVAGALGLLLAISGAVWVFRKTHPYLVVGWLWYLGMLIPAIGIVQISDYAHADRYTYLPQIGLYVAIVWTAKDFNDFLAKRPPDTGRGSTRCDCGFDGLHLGSKPHIGELMKFCGNAPLPAPPEIMLPTIIWVMTWHTKDGPLKPSHIIRKPLRSTPILPMAHNNLGTALLNQGRLEEASEHYHQALDKDPAFAEAHNNLGILLTQQGRTCRGH